MGIQPLINRLVHIRQRVFGQLAVKGFDVNRATTGSVWRSRPTILMAFIFAKCRDLPLRSKWTGESFHWQWSKFGFQGTDRPGDLADGPGAYTRLGMLD